MKKSQTVFLTTIFPASEGFLHDFFRSLQSQTEGDFDVLVINDGVLGFDEYKGQYADLNIIEEISTASPAKNREFGIIRSIELGYKNIIFGDSDDFFSKNRVAESIEGLKDNDIVVNELTIFSLQNRIDNFFAKHLKSISTAQDNILNGNIFGFSNIAVCSSIIKENLKFDDSLIAVDWFFITILLLGQKPQIKFLGNVQTFYRQYGNNTIGMSLLLTVEKLDLGLSVKYIHYSLLTEHCQRNNLEKYSVLFENKLIEIQKLKEELINSSFKEKYINVINTNFPEIFSGWWSEILIYEDYLRYEDSDQ